MTGLILAAPHMPKHLPSDWIGWAVIIVVGLLILRKVAK